MSHIATEAKHRTGAFAHIRRSPCEDASCSGCDACLSEEFSRPLMPRCREIVLPVSKEADR